MPPADDRSDLATVAHLRSLGRALDGAIGVPGTNLRIGLDPILGLLPVAGDWIGGLMSAYIVIRSVGLGVSGATAIRMVGNLAVDLAIGAVPVLGDVFDFVFRANERNLKLLEAHVQAPVRRRRADLVVVVGVAAVLLAIIVGVVMLTVFVVGKIVAMIAASL